MTSLHDWHREVFCKRTPTTLVFPAYSTIHGGNFPETRSEVTLASARSVVVQRVVNSLTPEEWTLAQEIFDASSEGLALKTRDVADRREHCELWLLHLLHEADHPELVVGSELALQKVLAHHAHEDKIEAHKDRLLAHLEEGEPLAPDDAPVIVGKKSETKPSPKGDKPEVKP